MVENLCTNYGKEICTVGQDELGFEGNNVFYSFPTVEQLCEAKGVEQRLRTLGFGYR